MTFFLLFSAIILGFLFEKSKAVSAYILSAMYLLAAFNYDNYDYYSYTISYAKTAGLSFDFRYIGYSMFIHFFSSRGLTYSQYLKFAFIPVFIILFIAVCKLTDKPNRVLALFLIFPFGIDAIQLKALYSEVFALLGIALLFDKISDDTKKNFDYRYIWSAVLFILSVLFHFSGAFYLAAVIVFYYFRKKYWFNKAVIFSSAIGFLAVFSGVLPAVMSIAESVGILSNVDYLSSYASRSTRWGFIITFIPVFLMVGACWCLYQPDKHTMDESSKSKKQIIIQQFVLTGLLILPLLMMHMVFDRLARVYMILMYVLFANAPRTRRITVKQVFAYSMFVISIACFFYIDIFSSFDGTLLALLNYSELFSF